MPSESGQSNMDASSLLHSQYGPIFTSSTHKPFLPAAQAAKSYLTCKLPRHSGTTYSPFSQLKEAPAPCEISQPSTEEKPPTLWFLAKLCSSCMASQLSCFDKGQAKTLNKRALGMCL